MAAAVADFRPKQVAGQKLKKAEGAPEIILEPTPDILAGLGARRRPAQVLVGFAAETAAPDQARDQLRRYALDKLAAKGQIWSSPTTWRPPAWASLTTPMPC